MATSKAPEQPKAKRSDVRIVDRRARQIALLCTLGLFVVMAVFVFFDQQKAEQRDEAMATSVASATPRTSPAPPPASAPPATPQAKPAPAPQSASRAATRPQAEPQKNVPAPREVARNPSQLLNDTLTAAAGGDWKRVDQLLTGAGGASSIGGAARAAPTSEQTQRGREAIAAGDYSRAIEALNAALTANANDAEALNLLAFALLREKKAGEAQLQVTRSLTLAPANAPTWANAAEILAEQDNPVAAAGALRVAIHLSRDRQKTLGFLKDANRSVQSAKFRAVIAEVLPEFDKIPPARRAAS